MSADPVLYARLVDLGPDGTATQVNEAARRGLLSEDLTAAEQWTVSTPKVFNLTFYPMDHALAPGHRLIAYTGVSPASVSDPASLSRTGPTGNAGFVITPAQAQVTYGQGTVGFTLTNTTLMEPQPVGMRCFTC
ncbi:MAG: hypothetical protein ABR586_10415 [Thermoplasmatota archaeon]